MAAPKAQLASTTAPSPDAKAPDEPIGALRAFASALPAHYPLLLFAAIAFNFGYLSWFDSSAITLLNVWDHLALFIKNAVWVIAALVLLMYFILICAMIGQKLAGKRYAFAGSTALFLLIIFTGIAVGNDWLTYSCAAAGLVPMIVAQSLAEDGGKPIDFPKPVIFMFAAPVLTAFVVGAGQFVAEREVSGAPQTAVSIDGRPVSAHLISALHSGTLIHDGKRLRWVPTDKLGAVYFPASATDAPSAPRNVEPSASRKQGVPQGGLIFSAHGRAIYADSF